MAQKSCSTEEVVSKLQGRFPPSDLGVVGWSVNNSQDIVREPYRCRLYTDFMYMRIGFEPGVG